MQNVKPQVRGLGSCMKKVSLSNDHPVEEPYEGKLSRTVLNWRWGERSPCRPYEIRQSYILHGRYLNYNEMDRRMQSHEAYKALPAKVSQQVLKQLHHDWDAFFKARAAYKEDPSKFKAR